jgi:phasin family protein
MAQVKKKKAGNKKVSAKKTAKKPKINKTVAAKKVTQSSTQTMENVMTQGKTQFDKFAQEAAVSSKEQVDAFMKSGGVFMKGFEEILKTYVSMSQTTAEKNSQAVKSFLGCKNLNDFTEAQNKFARQNFEDFMSGATKLSELSIKVTTESFAPINDQMSKTIKKATESVAA